MSLASLLGLVILLVALCGWLVLLLATVEPLLWLVIRRGVAARPQPPGRPCLETPAAPSTTRLMGPP